MVGNGGVNFRIQDVAKPAPNDSGHMYYAGMLVGNVVLGTESGGMSGGQWSQLAEPSGGFSIGTPHAFRVTVKANSIDVSVDGMTYISSLIDPSYTFGSIGLRTYLASATFANLKVTCQ
jgi:hypothetical protein